MYPAQMCISGLNILSYDSDLEQVAFLIIGTRASNKWSEMYPVVYRSFSAPHPAMKQLVPAGTALSPAMGRQTGEIVGLCRTGSFSLISAMSFKAFFELYCGWTKNW